MKNGCDLASLPHLLSHSLNRLNEKLFRQSEDKLCQEKKNLLVLDKDQLILPPASR
jgi:hypothetical protein